MLLILFDDPAQGLHSIAHRVFILQKSNASVSSMSMLLSGSRRLHEVIAPLQLIMGSLIILPLLALGVSAFFSFTRPDKA